MALLHEFKAFAMKGNVVDLAVGVVIGTAFGKIVSALVDKVLMPPIGYAIGGVDFSRLRLILNLPGAKEEVAIGYGEFLQSCFNFLIIAWAMFLIIKLMNRLHLKGETPAKNGPAAAAPPPPTKEEISLLREIRDLLRQNKPT